MNRNTFYFKQQLKSNDLNEYLQENIEKADRDIVKDFLGDGILTGLEVEKRLSNDFFIEIKKGVAYKNGFRISLPINETRDFSSYQGENVYITIAIKFARYNHNEKTDGLGDTIMYQNDESYEIIVLTNWGNFPIADSDSLVLADILVEKNTTTIDFSRVRRLPDELTLIKMGNFVKETKNTLDNIPVVTPSKDGFMSKEDKTKLNGIANSANNYSHPSSCQCSLTSIPNDLLVKGTFTVLKNVLCSGFKVAFSGTNVRFGICDPDGSFLGPSKSLTEASGSERWWEDG